MFQRGILHEIQTPKFTTANPFASKAMITPNLGLILLALMLAVYASEGTRIPVTSKTSVPGTKNNRQVVWRLSQKVLTCHGLYSESPSMKRKSLTFNV
jgi:hypothetical protein